MQRSALGPASLNEEALKIVEMRRSHTEDLAGASQVVVDDRPEELLTFVQVDQGEHLASGHQLHRILSQTPHLQ